MGGQVQLVKPTRGLPSDIVCQSHPDHLSEGHVRRGEWSSCVEEVECVLKGINGHVYEGEYSGGYNRWM